MSTNKKNTKITQEYIHSLSTDINTDWHNNPKIDERIRKYFSRFSLNVNTERDFMKQLLNDPDELAGGDKLISRDNFIISEKSIISSPDNNQIQLSIIKPKNELLIIKDDNTNINTITLSSSLPLSSSIINNDILLPCVIYIHGGGMKYYSCFYENYQTFGRLISSNGVIVILPDFRNYISPSTPNAEISKFPGGLNDCISTIEYVYENYKELNVDKNNIIICGESGGGNLSIASCLSLKRNGKINIIKGMYIMCPYLAGKFPNPKYPSTYDNAGILMVYPTKNDKIIIVNDYSKDDDEDLHETKNPLAFPSYATSDDIIGLPKSKFVVNEFDPLRDEGIDFYNRCKNNGLDTSLEILKGTIHGTGSYFVNLCPDITIDQALKISNFAKY